MSNTFPISAALGDAGDPIEFTVGAKTYKMGHPTQCSKDRFCKALIQTEVRGARRLKDSEAISQEEFNSRIEDIGRQAERGDHQPGGPLFLKYSLGKDWATGSVLFVWSLLVENHPELTIDTVREVYGYNAATIALTLRQIVPLFFEWVTLQVKLTPEQMTLVKKELTDLPSKIDKLLLPTLT